uniref:Uncharacterized protein n=1 Tax=Ananas comosus var. bracteatus TaxID=296719 RepID=A0A6V7NW63_ANACO|nr:unnamed protein product [Ananas comosus var. bracteatus]
MTRKKRKKDSSVREEGLGSKKKQHGTKQRRAWDERKKNEDGVAYYTKPEQPDSERPRETAGSTCASFATTATEREALACTGQPRARPTPTSPAPPLDPHARRPPRAPAPCVPLRPPSSAQSSARGAVAPAELRRCCCRGAANEAAADARGRRGRGVDPQQPCVSNSCSRRRRAHAAHAAARRGLVRCAAAAAAAKLCRGDGTPEPSSAAELGGAAARTGPVHAAACGHRVERRLGEVGVGRARGRPVHANAFLSVAVAAEEAHVDPAVARGRSLSRLAGFFVMV